MATGARQFKVLITAASLLIRKVKISPSVYLHGTRENSRERKGQISYSTCYLQILQILARYLDVSHEKLFSDLLPVRLISGLVGNRAYNSDRERNLFNFQYL
jgi:hypothetical protein